MKVLPEIDADSYAMKTDSRGTECAAAIGVCNVDSDSIGDALRSGHRILCAFSDSAFERVQAPVQVLSGSRATGSGRNRSCGRAGLEANAGR